MPEKISKTAKASIAAGGNTANVKKEEPLTLEKAVAELRAWRKAGLWPGTALIDMLLAEHDRLAAKVIALEDRVAVLTADAAQHIPSEQEPMELTEPVDRGE